MTRAHCLHFHRFATMPQWVGTLNVRAAVVAAQNGFPLSAWEEDGLGPAVGFLCALPSGRVLLVEEFEHTINHLGGTGADLMADLTEVVRDGASAILAEAVDCLGLSPKAIETAPDPASQAELREMLDRLPPPGGNERAGIDNDAV